MNTIEKLSNIDKPAPIAPSRWQLIELIESFRPRSDPVFCAWNKREIIILGGNDEDEQDLGDGWVLDLRTDTLKKVIEPSENSLKFTSDDK